MGQKSLWVFSKDTLDNFNFPERVLAIPFVGQTWYKQIADIHRKLPLPEALTLSFRQGPIGLLGYRLKDNFLKFCQRHFENFHLLFNIMCNNELN